MRNRTVYNMEVDLNVQNNENVAESEEFLFKLTLCTQAGTYVKEFVHGDFGRTSPNMCSILNCDVDIIALDVEVGLNEVLLDILLDIGGLNFTVLTYKTYVNEFSIFSRKLTLTGLLH